MTPFARIVGFIRAKTDSIRASRVWLYIVPSNRHIEKLGDAHADKNRGRGSQPVSHAAEHLAQTRIDVAF
jgi:hypothetical protein